LTSPVWMCQRTLRLVFINGDNLAEPQRITLRTEHAISARLMAMHRRERMGMTAYEMKREGSDHRSPFDDNTFCTVLAYQRTPP
jgi:hypothetical protein